VTPIATRPPGSQSSAGAGWLAVTTTPIGIRLLFHAWTGGSVGYDSGGERRLYVETIPFELIRA